MMAQPVNPFAQLREDAEALLRVVQADYAEEDAACADETAHDPLPDYPVDVFPTQLEALICEGAASLDAPPIMIALPLLGCAAAAIGSSRYLEAKGGWKERAILWCAVVAKPGTAKSPAAEIARGPLMVLQREARVRWEAAKAHYAADLATWESLDRATRAATGKPIPPVVEHFFSTNSTKESVESMASTSPGFGLYRDELVAWVKGFDAYRSGRGGDRQDMLSLWSGSDLKVDRKTADPIFADQPTVSVIGTLQPDRLGDLASEAGNDGFLDRFLWAYVTVPPMRLTTATICPETTEAATALFRRLRIAHAGDGVRVSLARDAWDAYATWHEANREMQIGAPPLLSGTYSKLTTYAVRLALVLYCLWYPDPTATVLSRETMEDALSLIEVHRAHAGAVLAHFRAVGMVTVAGVPRRILRALERAQERGEPGLSRTALYRALGNAVSKDALSRALAELQDGGHIASMWVTGTGKPSELWCVVSEGGTTV